jgi:hypothetical protein
MRHLLLLVLAGCGAADARSESPALPPPMTPVKNADEIAQLRKEGPAALERLLAQYDGMQPSAERDALGDKIDRVAAQRYATASRMFWYTDLETAKAEAKKTGKPILSLRMLGRLDEDLSCANSRYFRVALYANTGLSKWLREHFILHWSSERAVPRVTIDFGDGRKIERTLTGNSAHYVLDADGRPIDVLPGLYAPAVFRGELEKSLALAKDLARLPDEQRSIELAEYHRRATVDRNTQWKKIARVQVPAAEGFRPEAFAQMVTVTKSGYELPTYQVVDLGVKVGKMADDAQAWAQVGLRLMPPPKPGEFEEITLPVFRGGRIRVRSGYVRGSETGTYQLAPEPPIAVGEVLDAGSKALLARLSPVVWTEKPTTATADELKILVNRFERDILADTAINEFDLRMQIHGLFSDSPTISFDQLNDEIYRTVFATPKDDPWLGLAPSGVTALPGDGLVSIRK